MAQASDIARLWNTVDFELLEKLDSSEDDCYWNTILKEYQSMVDATECSNKSRKTRDLLVIMLCLMHTPDVLQSNYKEETRFQQSASDFFSSYVNITEDEKFTNQLVSDLFSNYKTIIDPLPVSYQTQPTDFLKSLARILLAHTTDFMGYTKLENLTDNLIGKVHELYAAICETSPYCAFIMCEIAPLFPSKRLDGTSLETVPFLPHFFNYQTISTPFFDDNRLVYSKMNYSIQEEIEIVNQVRQMMSRVHNAQIRILRCFLTASYVSRDYVLNLIGALINANRSRRLFLAGSLSSDGLMMNLSMCLLEVIGTFLESPPSLSVVKSFVLYVFSDTSRADFIKGNLPSDAENVECIYLLMNWLRPMNYYGREEKGDMWWTLAHSQPKEVKKRIDDGLKCKPGSSLSSFLKAISGISDSLLFTTPSLMNEKPFFDYSYNFSFVGKTATPIAPFSVDVPSCTKCKAHLTSSYFRCLCCEKYYLCQSCYQREKEAVIKEFTPPFSESVRKLFNKSSESKNTFKSHNPLTHFFTEVHCHPLGINNCEVFHPLPSFPPLIPDTYDPTNDSPINSDSHYEKWSHLTSDPIDTVCSCYTDRPCSVHGPIASVARSVTKKAFPSIPDTREEGFIHQATCFQCHSTPVIGTLYHCLDCSLRLCRSCYEREMQEGKGFPSHQFNHVFVHLYHPVDEGFFLAHNRNDRRTIMYSTPLLTNELCMTGVTLDHFLPVESDSNAGNLSIELLAMAVKLMNINMTGLFQDYRFYATNSFLRLTSDLRTAQLSVGCMNNLYIYLSEHLSYILLTFLTLYTPRSYPLSDKWKLNVIQVDSDFHPSSQISNEVNDSKLCDGTLLDMQPLPLFGVLSKTLLENIMFMFEWYMRVTPFYIVVQELGEGRFDYTILLLLCCLNENVISNISTRMDVLRTLFVMCSITKDKRCLECFFEYPVIRHLLFTFSLKLFIDVTSFQDPGRVRQVQMEINKVVSLLIRSETCGGEGFHECEQLFEGLGISLDLFPLYIEDLIRQTNNQQDVLNDFVNKFIKDTSHSYRSFVVPIVESIKAAVNLFVHIINDKIMQKRLFSNYLLKRTTRFFLVIFSSITEPVYYENISSLSKNMGMTYNRWLTVILEQIIQLVKDSPYVNSLDDSVQPSVAVSVDNNPHYKNAVLISMVEDDGCFDISHFSWAVDYANNEQIFKRGKYNSLVHMVSLLKDYQNHFEMINSAIDDCPEEFLDSLMDTIMQDPVILPSGNRCDRSSIIRQLSISPIDPFTRSPLTMDMVKPDPELKERIHQYIKTRVEELQHS